MIQIGANDDFVKPFIGEAMKMPNEPPVMWPTHRATRKVLLIFQGRLFRDGLRSMLQTSNLKIVGDCDTVAQADTLLDSCESPDLVMIGLAAEPYDNFSRISALRERLPNARWILLCDKPATDVLRNAFGAGIDGILLQDVSAEILHHIVELMLLGHSLIPWEFAHPLVYEGGATRTIRADPGLNDPAAGKVQADAELSRAGNDAVAGRLSAPGPAMAILPPALPSLDLNGRHDGRQGRAANLSDREDEILQHLIRGASNKAIARELNIAEATVKVHVKGLLRKMRLQNRTQAAIWAISNPAHSRAEPEVYQDGSSTPDSYDDDGSKP